LERVSFLYDHFLNACLNLIAYRKAAYYNAEIAGKTSVNDVAWLVVPLNRIQRETQH
jgi:hypothetical protein